MKRVGNDKGPRKAEMQRVDEVLRYLRDGPCTI
jgi:hypothetical protein